jgi:hypothetical protein
MSCENPWSRLWTQGTFHYSVSLNSTEGHINGKSVLFWENKSDINGFKRNMAFVLTAKTNVDRKLPFLTATDVKIAVFCDKGGVIW